MRSLEETLAYHCAPALAGIKPANLISCAREGCPEMDRELSRLNRELGPAGVCFRPVCRCGGRTLLLVYRRAALERHLADRRVRGYLAREGYPTGDLEATLGHLQERLASHAGFPHEMGVLLGYPPEDVEGYRRDGGRNCKLCGYWKVYGDAQRAQELFARFTRCREALLSRIQSGYTMVALFGVRFPAGVRSPGA